jgi:hypothetical protein
VHEGEVTPAALRRSARVRSELLWLVELAVMPSTTTCVVVPESELEAGQPESVEATIAYSVPLVAPLKSHESDILFEARSEHSAAEMRSSPSVSVAASACPGSVVRATQSNPPSRATGAWFLRPKYVLELMRLHCEAPVSSAC